MGTATSPSRPHEGKGMDYMDKPKDTAGSAMDKAKDIAGTAVDKASSFADKAKDTAGDMVEKAKDAAGNLVDKAKDTASNLGQKAEDATHAVGSGLQSLAGTVRGNMPKEGMIGAASSSVAQGLETSGKYLEHEGLQGIAADMTNLVRRNPIPALLLGIGLGFILARATTSRS